jgi:hypothetical protein
MPKMRTSIWVDPNLVLLLRTYGLDLSSFVNKALIEFLELPGDPREKLIREKMDDTVLRLRSTYENEMREIMKDYAKNNTSKIAQETRQAEQEKELYSLGENLKSLNFYPKLEKCLKDPDLADDYWDQWVDAAAIISSKNGKKWDENVLWSTALDWWKKYGKARS